MFINQNQQRDLCFNEAALHEGRKLQSLLDVFPCVEASMRPPFMKGGNGFVELGKLFAESWLQ